MKLVFLCFYKYREKTLDKRNISMYIMVRTNEME